MKTVGLELAKTLKEKGYPQKKSTFYWCKDLGESTFSKNCEPYLKRTCGEHPAIPTADEILDLLPHHIDKGNRYLFRLLKRWDTDLTGKDEKYYGIGYYSELAGEWIPNLKDKLNDKTLCESKSVADACAMMWLYLKEKRE